ncbi:coiled-coil domain-containing protein 157-like [Siniperca chuatsi]|uniref:coiled-coil domain-containing protein 157-like n=1 Tax=Siniperca chuatsi TaxID=119488 RepID=UPI001CE14DA4|nr:coiled-coil domain-containing protein 157-like [Siniperca chuatsi]
MEFSEDYGEVDPSFNFYLSSLEAQARCELKDSEARLTQGRSEGRVLLEIQEEALSKILDQLQEQREDKWSPEKKLMQKEICCLKARQDEAQAKHVHSSQREMESLKSNLRKICVMLRKAQNDLVQQTSQTEHLQVKLEEMKAENGALQHEVGAMKLELRVAKQLRAVAENNCETTTHCLKVQLFDKDTAEFEARTKAELLEKDLIFERAQAQKLQMKLSKMEEALLKKKEEAKRTLERSQASHQAQLEEHKAQTSKIASALKKAEDLLETERLRLQQEKTCLQEEMEKSTAFYVAQLDEQKRENIVVMAALEKVKQQLESRRIEWQEDKSSLLQATEGLMQTLQEKEQEWEKTESSMRSQLKELERQITKKKKWYRKLF